MFKKDQIITLCMFLALILAAQTCPNNCLFCLQQSQCVTCQNQYFLTTEGKCIQQKVSNCRTYFPNQKCAVCQPTFTVSENGQSCQKDLSGCLLRSPNKRCVQCHFGTTLNIQGECLGVINCAKPQRNCQACRTGFNLINNRCIYSGQDCLVIQSNGLCTECRSDYVLNGFECVSKASNSVINGNINLIEKCSLYSRKDNSCLQCESGYTLFENKCQSKGQVYQETIDKANMKIRQPSNKTFIGTDSEKIEYKKITYSLKSQPKDDVLSNNDAQQSPKQVNKILFQGIGGEDKEDHCLSKNSNSNNCNVCIDGYYLFNGICYKRTQICQRYNITNFKCLKCNQNYALQNGECVDLKCLQSQLSNCQKCKPGFVRTNQGICLDGNCIQRINGTCTTCVNGYVLNSNGLCYKIIPGCETYSENVLFCQKCLSGYILSATGICRLNTNPRCLILNQTDSSKCTRCRDEYALNAAGKCIDLYCLEQESPDKCRKCKPGYLLNVNSSNCYDQNCVLYNNGSCTNCANNYKLQNGFCVKILIGCLTVDTVTQKCTSCLDVYKLQPETGTCLFNQNGRCSKYINGGLTCGVCKIEYALINGQCVDLKCQNQQFINNFFSCIICKPGFNLTNYGKCYDEHCLQTSNGTCDRCADEYVINQTQNGLCVKASIACAAYDATTKRCIACLPGYSLNVNSACVLNTTSSVIDKPDTLTPGDIVKPNNTNTNNTSTNSTTNNTTNNTNTNIDPLCRTYNNQKQCTGCITGRYYIRNNRCEAVPLECRSYNPRTGKCIQCQPAYALYSPEQQAQFQNCVLKPTQADPNCQVRDLNQFCIRCRTGYYILDGICYLADTQCKTFKLVGGQCLSCYDGFTIEKTRCISLTKQANCITYDFQNICIECKDRFYSNAGVCRQVNAICQTYEMMTGNCLSCKAGYSFVNNSCTKVLAITPNCKNQDLAGKCVQCNNRFYLNSSTSQCLLVNPLCNDYNTTTGWCKNCTNGYTLRPTIGQCVLQTSDPLCNKFSYQGICQGCSSGYFLTTNNLRCSVNIPSCQQYNLETGDCQLCVSTHYLSFKKCQIRFKRDKLDQNCQQGDLNNFCLRCKDRYFINAGLCLKANDLCRTFSVNTGACTECYDGYGLKSNECVLANGNTNNNNNTTTITVPITPSVPQDFCKLYSGSLCIQCVDRYYLNSNGNLPRCDAVNPLCKDYNMFNGNCYNCQLGYKLEGTGCVITIVDNNNTSNNNTTNTTNNSTAGKCQTGYVLVGQICVPNANTTTNSNQQSQQQIDANANTNNAGGNNGGIINGGINTVNNTNNNNTTNNTSNNTTNNTNNSQIIQIKEMNCLQYDVQNRKCLKCYTNYYYESAKFACIRVDSNCNLTDPLNGWCLSCNQGYMLQNLQCVLSTTSSSARQFEDVLTFDQQAKQRFCQNYNPVTKRCTTCNNGYQLLDDGSCSISGPNIITDPFCTAVTQTKCTNCLAGYYVDNLGTGKCTLMQSICANFNVIGGQCYKCNVDSILQDGRCFTPALGVDDNCALYNGVYCAGCKSGYKMVSFFCQPK